MKQLKRLTSVLLVLGMVLGLMPLSAFAAEPEDTAEKTFPVTVSDNGGENIYAYRLLGDDTVELTGFLPGVSVADVVIHSPVTLNGKVYSVVSIGDSAFIGCTALKSVRFEAPIKSIRSHAFAYCTALKSVQFEAPIESIGAGAFLECPELGEVELPASIISIGTAAFLGCAKWETVNLGNSVVSIGENAFALCGNLKSVTIPSSVQTIGADAFGFGPGGENKKLVELHYTGTQEQWDELAEKNDFTNKNPLLINPENFDCAHTVSFYYGNQAEETSKVVPKVVQYEKTVNKPTDPIAKGYRFEGWYTQENGGEPFDFNQETTEDVKVYAHWSEVKPDPKPEPKPEPEPTPTPTPDPDTAKEYTLTEKDGSLVCVTVEKNGTTVDITEKVVLEQQGTTQIGKIPAGAMVTVKANAAPEGMVFAQWNISDPALMGNPDVAHTSQTMTFPMPTADVTVEAMYESAENARETELLGSAAMIGAVGISAVVLAYQAHQLGTELYLKYLLPSGAALPQNRIQLAELLWKNAGEPVPDGNAAYEDIGLNDEAAQQAAQWALENKLMELPDAEHTGQFKPDERISYGEAIRAWNKAQQLKTAE